MPICRQPERHPRRERQECQFRHSWLPGNGPASGEVIETAVL